mmetsp:Transcript_117259/g.204167  ORF Transcript_117259/g.204167 Transcript_117259/m.204167 type:complete len:119 (-) Transcript_117259:32-388(-)
MAHVVYDLNAQQLLCEKRALVEHLKFRRAGHDGAQSQPHAIVLHVVSMHHALYPPPLPGTGVSTVCGNALQSSVYCASVGLQGQGMVLLSELHVMVPTPFEVLSDWSIPFPTASTDMV